MMSEHFPHLPDLPPSRSIWRSRSVRIFRAFCCLLVPLTAFSAACVQELPESILDEDRPKLERLLQGAEPSEERPDFPQNWSIQSANGEWVARQRTDDGQSCKVRASKRETRELVWESEGCLGTREDLRLLSADGEVIMVLFPEPVIDVMPLGDVEVGFLAERGQRSKALLARDFLDPASLRVGEESLTWLKLRNGGAIVQHRGSEVELSLSSRRQALVSFSGEIELGEVEQPRELGAQEDERWPEACPPSVPCTYVDSKGVFHMVESGSLVPREYWTVAKAIDGPVTEVGRAHEIQKGAILDEADGEPQPRAPQNFSGGGAGRRLPGRHPGSIPSTPPLQPSDSGWGETPFERSIRLGTRAGAPLPQPAPRGAAGDDGMDFPVDLAPLPPSVPAGGADNFPK